MADQDKLEAVVDLGDEVILLYKDPAQKQPEDNASFTGIKDFESLRFQRTDGPYVLWPAKDGMGSYTKGLIMPDCLKQGWHLEVGGMKCPITVKGQAQQPLGWKRDLTRECVEANPGPVWDEIRGWIETTILKTEEKKGKWAPVFNNFEQGLHMRFPGQVGFIEQQVRDYLGEPAAKTLLVNNFEPLLEMIQSCFKATGGGAQHLPGGYSSTTSVHFVVAGWKRDLLRECVEPNPGPTAGDIIDKLATKLRWAKEDERLVRLYKEICTISGEEVPDAKHIPHEIDLGIIQRAFSIEGNSVSIENAARYRGYLVEVLNATSDKTAAATGSVGQNSGVRNPKRLREDDAFYYPSNRQKVAPIQWLSNGVLKIVTERSSYHFFSANAFVEPLQHWIKRLNDPLLSSQEKSLLFVDGAVKSGKTTLCKTILPFLLTDKKIVEEDFCFAYLDLSALAGITTANGKWDKINALLGQKLGDVWPDGAEARHYEVKVQDSLRALKDYGIQKWIIVLDEYHFIFNALNETETEAMAEQMKLIILDDGSPCYFVLAGSTQASFWWALGKARPNGLNMLTGATILTTPFTSNDDEIQTCVDKLEHEEHARTEHCLEILDILALRNVANLCQTARRIVKGDCSTTVEAYNNFVESKIEVYWRDYHAVPDGIPPDTFIGWANGSPVDPPRLLRHLLIKRGDLYYLKDPNFEAFLKLYYDPRTSKLIQSKDAVCWADVLLFIPLLPLGQTQKSGKLDEAKFEQDAQQLHSSSFDSSAYNAFGSYLVDHAANLYYKQKGYTANQLSWVLVMRLLRNIVAHEHTTKWVSIRECLDQVLLYMQSRENFRTLIRTEELCIKI